MSQKSWLTGRTVRADRTLREAELDILRMVRARLGHPMPVRVAQTLSTVGEHSIGWVACGLTGALIDRRRRRDWLVGTAAVFGAHAAAVVIKQVVRRRRPQADDLPPLGGVPSQLSFPSAHACSTTAAAVMFAPMVGVPVCASAVGVMSVSRLLLGVHYPTDVLAGVAAGAGIAAGTRALAGRVRRSPGHGPRSSSRWARS